MNAPEGLDIRAPIGGLFTVLGGMLAAYGLFVPQGNRSPHLASGMNVNLWWGLVMLAFGIVLLVMARRAGRRATRARDSVLPGVGRREAIEQTLV